MNESQKRIIISLVKGILSLRAKCGLPEVYPEVADEVIYKAERKLLTKEDAQKEITHLEGTFLKYHNQLKTTA